VKQAGVVSGERAARGTRPLGLTEVSPARGFDRDQDPGLRARVARAFRSVARFLGRVVGSLEGNGAKGLGPRKYSEVVRRRTTAWLVGHRGWIMTRVLDPRMSKPARERVLHLSRRLAELDAWQDSSVKLVAQEAIRAEIARVGREMVELEWKWI
jgi:hypothetical protein